MGMGDKDGSEDEEQDEGMDGDDNDVSACKYWMRVIKP